MGQVVSVNVAREASVPWRGNRVRTGIYKEPVRGAVQVGRLGLAGDFQADLRVHGGPTKAVYFYPAEHYERWKAELGIEELPWGAFGENLTITGLDEQTVRVGDKLRVGSALLLVTQPREPCFKLGTKFGDMSFIRRFAESGRSGFYCAVVEEGLVTEGDLVDRVELATHGKTIHSTALRSAAKRAAE